MAVTFRHILISVKNYCAECKIPTVAFTSPVLCLLQFLVGVMNILFTETYAMTYFRNNNKYAKNKQICCRSTYHFYLLFI